MKTILLPVFLLFLFVSPNKLVGRWESVSPTGNVTGVVFKDDNSFEGYVNDKPFVSGTYSLKDSTFQMSDNGCEGLTGSYILHFFSKNDSFRLELVNDPCTPRGQGTNGRVFGRKK
jgi:hypothetical protein